MPGESGLLIAAAMVDSWGFFVTLALVATACAAVGDNIGYLLGRRYGIRVRETMAVRKRGQQHWDRATRLLRRFGIGAVLVARFGLLVRRLLAAALPTAQLEQRWAQARSGARPDLAAVPRGSEAWTRQTTRAVSRARQELARDPTQAPGLAHAAGDVLAALDQCQERLLGCAGRGGGGADRAGVADRRAAAAGRSGASGPAGAASRPAGLPSDLAAGCRAGPGRAEPGRARSVGAC